MTEKIFLVKREISSLGDVYEQPTGKGKDIELTKEELETLKWILRYEIEPHTMPSFREKDIEKIIKKLERI